MQNQDWSSLIPPAWVSRSDLEAVWITGFRCLLIGKHDLNQQITLDLGDNRAVLLWGVLDYEDSTPTIEFRQGDGAPRAKIKPHEVRQTPEACWLILMQPYVGGSQSLAPEGRVLFNSRYLGGLFGSLCGRNTIFERTFDWVYPLGCSRISPAAGPFLSPLAFGRPAASVGGFHEVQQAFKRIESFPESTANRIRLSLHWYESSVRDLEFDGFVKLWVALEALAMPDATNVKPLHSSLASAYAMSRDQAREKFRLGQIQGFRSRVLHNGQLPIMHAGLLPYMDGVFADIFRQTIGLECRRRAETALLSGGASISEIIRASAE